MMPICAGVQLVQKELYTDDQMINHESFDGSLKQELIPNTDKCAEDWEQYDYELGHKPNTNISSLNFFNKLHYPIIT